MLLAFLPGLRIKAFHVNPIRTALKSVNNIRQFGTKFKPYPYSAQHARHLSKPLIMSAFDDSALMPAPPLSAPPHLSYVDVHAHVFHEEFAGDEDVIAKRCADFGESI